MVSNVRPCVQTLGNIAQPFPPSQLGKSHADELLPTAEMTHARLLVVAFHQTVESLAVDQIEELGQNKSAGIYAKKHGPISNASH